jgi:hypothetical protein
MSFSSFLILLIGCGVLGVIVRLVAIMYVRFIRQDMVYLDDEVRVFALLPPASVSAVIFRNRARLSTFPICLGVLSFSLDVLAPVLLLGYGVFLVASL